MKVLFITTFGVSLNREHFFTKNVYKILSHISHEVNIDLQFATVYISKESNQSQPFVVETVENHEYYQCYVNNGTHEDIINGIIRLLQQISPDVIHSNMIEGYDVQAARALGIPIVLTMHIGGLMCPRGGGNGFLDHDDTICKRAVGKGCAKCMLTDLPFPSLARFLYGVSSSHVRDMLRARINGRQILYLSPLLSVDQRIKDRMRVVEALQYAHLILANEKLVKLAEMNGLSGRVHLLPHGVAPRKPIPMPSIDGKIKFYVLGRIQYSKGLHNIIRAFDGIDSCRYELHIIGDAESARREQRYWRGVKRLAQDKNVVFHGRLPNDAIESVIKDCHVMIHGTFCLEVYGIAIAESLSLGRPVLATRCGGAEMQIKDGYNGWLVRPNDVDDLRRAILSILDNPHDVIAKADRAELPMPISLYVQKLVSLYRTIYAANK